MPGTFVSQLGTYVSGMNALPACGRSMVLAEEWDVGTVRKKNCENEWVESMRTMSGEVPCDWRSFTVKAAQG